MQNILRKVLVLFHFSVRWIVSELYEKTHQNKMDFRDFVNEVKYCNFSQKSPAKKGQLNNFSFFFFALHSLFYIPRYLGTFISIVPCPDKRGTS